jgi:hypothetical protein
MESIFHDVKEPKNNLLLSFLTLNLRTVVYILTEMLAGYQEEFHAHKEIKHPERSCGTFIYRGFLEKR